QASSKARQESDQIKTDAASYKEQLLTDTGGSDAETILDQIKQPGLSQEKQFELVGELSGQVRTEISEANLYRTTVVEDAKASAEYLRRLLPEYRKNQELVLQKIYQDAIEQVLAGADEKIFIQTREGMADEIRVLLNRDPNINKGKAKQNNAR
ncbi:MAG: hypothetical protein ACYSOK_01765, partial [Planctomycetota bacterium]